LEPGAFDWRRPQPSLRDSDACDWPPHPNTEVLGYCHASLRDIRIGCGALTFLSAADLREAFGECAELAPAFESLVHYDSASKLDALQTLRGKLFPCG